MARPLPRRGSRRASSAVPARSCPPTRQREQNAGVDVLEHEGLRFEVRDGGPADAPAERTVVLLHGFPGDLDSFAAVAAALHAEGLRTLALHQRGYADGARPGEVAAYAIPHLVGDVVALLDAAGLAAAHVVGHDWGGMVAWHLAGRHPERVRSVTVLSTPHPDAYRRSLVRSAQLLRSWYAVSWQLPWLPERMLLARGGAVLRRALAGSGLPDDVAERYTAGMRRPGRLTAALHWYRAAGRHPLRAGALGPVAVPTTYVYSSGDVALGRRAADDTAQFVDGPYRYEVLEGEPHWLPEALPERVAALVLAQVLTT